MAVTDSVLSFGLSKCLNVQILRRDRRIEPKKVREKSRECHNHKPQPLWLQEFHWKLEYQTQKALCLGYQVSVLDTVHYNEQKKDDSKGLKN